ncbi:MAG: response regulator transcription factor [Saprospiraceae bacterium]
MKTIQIAIVEDVEEYRKALQMMLNATPGLQCSQVYSNGESAVENIPKQKTDIVLVDINLPRMNGIEVMRMLKSSLPKIQCMVPTVFEDDDKIFDALAAGASGYLLKSTPPGKIMEAIRELHDGGSPMSTQIARKVVASFRQPTKEVDNPYEQMLTQREKEVLELLSKGKLYKQIAGELFISLETVKSHCHNIYEKLHVTTKMEAINKVFPRG